MCKSNRGERRAEQGSKDKFTFSSNYLKVRTDQADEKRYLHTRSLTDQNIFLLSNWVKDDANRSIIKAKMSKHQQYKRESFFLSRFPFSSFSSRFFSTNMQNKQKILHPSVLFNNRVDSVSPLPLID